MTESIRDHIIGEYIREFCNFGSACTRLPDNAEEGLLEEINNTYGTYYNFEDSVVVTDCEAAAGGICVINGYSETSYSWDGYGERAPMIKLDFFALDGRRNLSTMYETGFDHLCGSMYFYDGSTHEHLRLGEDADKIAEIKDYLGMDSSQQVNNTTFGLIHMIFPLIMAIMGG